MYERKIGKAEKKVMKKVTVIPIVVGALGAIMFWEICSSHWEWHESKTSTKNSSFGQSEYFEAGT